ncbi:MAG TPA: glycosyltransferase [Pyrinomonadaceae bacterium]
MRILQFAPRVCWPLNTGAKLRNYHLARVLSERAQVSLLAFTDDPAVTLPSENFYRQIITVGRDQAYSFRKVLRGALGRTPLPLLNYTTNEMKQMLARVLSENDFDFVQVESIHLMNYLPTIRAARSRPLVICDWHNIESELMRQYSQRESNVARRAYARKTARLVNECEQRALVEFDAHLTVSESDAERLRQIERDARIFVIENGVDTDYYTNEEIAAGPKNRVVFVGSMDYHANIDGAIDFARNVWPIVRKLKPEIVFTIVGRDPAPAVRALSEIEGVEVTGTVNDVRPYYREAIAAVVPLNVGGGSRLKILEAMAARVPVVSTTRGAEGLDVRNGKNILIADTNEELREAIVSVAENEILRGQIATAGRALVAERYDWSRLGTSLVGIYEELLKTS